MQAHASNRQAFMQQGCCACAASKAAREPILQAAKMQAHASNCQAFGQQGCCTSAASKAAMEPTLQASRIKQVVCNALGSYDQRQLPQVIELSMWPTTMVCFKLFVLLVTKGANQLAGHT
jgi:hypothetical protein